MKLASCALQLRCAASRAKKTALPALWLVSDGVRSGDLRAALRRLPKGSGFIFRHYEMQGRENYARELRHLCRQRRILFLVAGDWRLAHKIRADGVHLPEVLTDQARAIKARQPRMIITVAAHGGCALRRAYLSGADAGLLSPVFPTRSHPGAPALGAVHFAGLVRHSPLPVIALGGIDASNVRRLRASGAIGVAGVSGVA